MQPAIGYIRVSTEAQTEGVSIEAQEARIRAWAQTQGRTLLDIPHDDGISGCKLKNRPGAQRAIALACEHRAPLVVYSLSRMARSTREALDISEKLDKAGADLVSLSENIDTTTAAGKMMFRMLAVLAEFERDLVSERTRAALAHKKSKAERIGTVPYGSRLAADGVKLLREPRERLILAYMKRLHRRGNTIEQIVYALHDRHMPPRNGGEYWQPTQVRRLCQQQRGGRNRVEQKSKQLRRRRT